MITFCLSHYEWLNYRSGSFALKKKIIYSLVYLIMKMIHSYKAHFSVKKEEEEEEKKCCSSDHMCFVSAR